MADRGSPRPALQLISSHPRFLHVSADLLDVMLMDGTIKQRSVTDENGRTLSVYGLKDEDAAAAQPLRALGAAAAAAIPAEWTPTASDNDGSF